MSKKKIMLKEMLIAYYPSPLGLVIGNKALIEFLDEFSAPEEKKKIAKRR